mmetsp:Transcript_45187/g.131481  ORF Transcript_45187/g.131481 Transcript_45187/m.131481 type:complete len:203 (-) Transcript_45187:156-764(-)|eukprot:CAMPEP_0170297226 /NCGR_PEP_ID=MMETSP0116_2-20130129/48773_1 /TAXON_ID=400756 /ORGANISM="Durinskia baltica, Strain CSIRO CS-38" /LENGTH=202 /DNA_ID=CAMNT_0010548849 /DNA_START=13 /DNA_END=621 /DNA_ORIENTATION=-
MESTGLWPAPSPGLRHAEQRSYVHTQELRFKACLRSHLPRLAHDHDILLERSPRPAGLDLCQTRVLQQHAVAGVPNLIPTLRMPDYSSTGSLDGALSSSVSLRGRDASSSARGSHSACSWRAAKDTLPQPSDIDRIGEFSARRLQTAGSSAAGVQTRKASMVPRKGSVAAADTAATIDPRSARWEERRRAAAAALSLASSPL